MARQVVEDLSHLGRGRISALLRGGLELVFVLGALLALLEPRSKIIYCRLFCVLLVKTAQQFESL